MSKPAPGATIDSGNAQAAGLACCWLLNEGSGTTAADLSGRGNDGTLAGGPTWGTEAGNYSPYLTTFAGANLVGKTSASGLPVAFSGGAYPAWAMEVWARMSATVSLATVFGFGDRPGGASTTVGAKRYFLMFGGSAPNNNVYFWGESRDWNTGVAWVTDGAWHQYVFTTPGGPFGSTIGLYVDGVSSGSSSTVLETCPAEIYAGDHHPAGGDFGGDLALARLWSRDLSGSDVAALYADPYAMFAFGGSPNRLLSLRRRAALQ